MRNMGWTSWIRLRTGMHGGRGSFYRNGIRADLFSGSVAGVKSFYENGQPSVNTNTFNRLLLILQFTVLDCALRYRFVYWKYHM